METIKIIVEQATDGSYGAYAEKENLGITGAGDTLDEVKQSVNDCIESILLYFKDENIPQELKGEYKLVFVFNTQNLLDYYDKIFTRAALSRLTGINEKQLGHYIQGKHKPRKNKTQIIEKSLHKLGKELLSVQLT